MTPDRTDRTVDVPLRRTREGWEGPAFRVHVTRCDPLELDGRTYPGWSMVNVGNGQFAADGMPYDLTAEQNATLLEITQAAGVIGTGLLPVPLDPDDSGIGIAWGYLHVGPVPDALADLTAQSLANRLRQMVPVIIKARRKWIADHEAGRPANLSP